jgi:hypothetical protein
VFPASKSRFVAAKELIRQSASIALVIAIHALGNVNSPAATDGLPPSNPATDASVLVSAIQSGEPICSAPGQILLPLPISPD